MPPLFVNLLSKRVAFVTLISSVEPALSVTAPVALKIVAILKVAVEFAPRIKCEPCSNLIFEKPPYSL